MKGLALVAMFRMKDPESTRKQESPWGSQELPKASQFSSLVGTLPAGPNFSAPWIEHNFESKPTWLMKEHFCTQAHVAKLGHWLRLQ